MPATAAQPASGRRRRVLGQFIKFGLVGGTGVVVNTAVAVAARKTGLQFGVDEHQVFLNLLGTRWNIRWSHVYATLAFLVANIWNFQLNRSWTFRVADRPNWFRQFLPFLVAGLSGLVVGLVTITALTNPTSPLALPPEIFDDSTGLRTRFYWANLIGVLLGTPANFLINKLWTFRARGRGESGRVELA
ncbi:GtrA family protein [Corynebacterium sphenisci]|uniref:GtrA family protein n=1 Tax=Corynebacterium sphenisci TaxID=191493 RepID=UPI0026DEB147|nr:GtrA family protein [Corynebacterium sphenisci]MDO5731703.1 GtrA family protein [Corynebacterium sphenisci]